MVSCDKVVSRASSYGDELRKPVPSRFFLFGAGRHGRARVQLVKKAGAPTHEVGGCPTLGFGSPSLVKRTGCSNS